MKLATVDEMRELDRRAAQECAIPEEILMENAGEAVYYALFREMGVSGQQFLVLCGLGNNGGDGLVVARKLHSSGGRVEVAVLGDPASYRGAAALHFRMLAPARVRILIQPSAEVLGEALARCDAVVDGLLGTGLTRDVGGATPR